MRHRGRVESIRPRGTLGRHDLRRVVVPGGQQVALEQERGYHALVARECPQQGGEKLSWTDRSLAPIKSSVISKHLCECVLLREAGTAAGWKVEYVNSELVVSRRKSIHVQGLQKRRGLGCVSDPASRSPLSAETSECNLHRSAFFYHSCKFNLSVNGLKLHNESKRTPKWWIFLTGQKLQYVHLFYDGRGRYLRKLQCVPKFLRQVKYPFSQLYVDGSQNPSTSW